MIDLHIHTNYSDGSLSPIEILKKAEEIGLTTISITDHDNCLAYDELKKLNIKDYYSGKIITGVELCTAVNGINIEILGYKVDTDYINKKVKEMFIDVKEKNKIRLERIYNACKKAGVKIDDDVLQRYYLSNGSHSTPFIWKEIIKYDYNKKFLPDEESWQETNLFYRNHITKPDDILFCDNSDLVPKPKAVCDLIKEARGLVFIPHLFLFPKYEEILDYLMENCKIDGIECFYNSFSKEQTEYLIKYCNEHKLYMSGGSDYHGEIKPTIELGIGKGNLNISNEVISNWVK